MLIVPYQDGPYLVRGPVTVRDQEGREIKLTRDPVALCRCGKSRMRPFCDGTHRLVRFTAPSSPETPWSEPDAVAGGRETQPAVGAPLPRPRLSSKAVASTHGSAVPGTSRAAVVTEAGSSAARRELGRVKERLGARLEMGPHWVREHLAMRSAEPLIGAAWLLLGERRSVSGRHDPWDVQAPARHLISGALDVLSAAASEDDGHLSELIEQLEAVLGLLESGARLA